MPFVKKDNTNIVINVLRESSLVLPPSKNYKDAGYVNGLELMPGENNVMRGYWEEVKKRMVIKKWVAAKYIEDKGEGEAVALTDTLGSLTAVEAAKYIKVEKDATIVMKWRDAEKRSTVKDMCVKRIRSITLEEEDDD